MNDNDENQLEDMDLIEENTTTSPLYSPLVLTDYEAATGKTAPSFLYQQLDIEPGCRYRTTKT